MANGFFPLVAPNAGGGLNFEPVNNALMNFQQTRARNQAFEQERQNQNALMQRHASSDSRAQQELAMRKQQFEAEQAQRAQMMPLELERNRMLNANTQSEIDARKAAMAAQTRTQQREEEFYNQFAPTPPAGLPAPNKLGGPMPEQGVGRFSSIGAAPAMPPPLRAGAPTGQSFDVAQGEPGPGLQVGDPMPKAQPVAPQAAPQQPVTLRTLFDKLTPENKAIAQGLLAAGKKEDFVKMLQAGGNPDAKPPTEQQSKDAFFVRRMMDETARLDKLLQMNPETGEIKGYDPTKANPYAPNDKFDIAGGFLGSIPTRQFNPEGWNRYYDAARSFVATILRKDTGATVTKEEMDWYFPMLFPQPGDKPANVKDKAERRREYMEGLKASAGPLSDRINGNYTPGGGQWKMERLD
jgi:hypothetical protein